MAIRTIRPTDLLALASFTRRGCCNEAKTRRDFVVSASPSEPLPDVAWRLSAQEPPGTQAARWDTEAGYWRWLHGTLLAEVTPASHPYGAANVVSGVTRPEVGANVWISDPRQSLPQAVTLTAADGLTSYAQVFLPPDLKAGDKRDRKRKQIHGQTASVLRALGFLF